MHFASAEAALLLGIPPWWVSAADLAASSPFPSARLNREQRAGRFSIASLRRQLVAVRRFSFRRS
jgi:hypothetical protein